MPAPIDIETLGALADHVMSLSFSCAECHRNLALTLDEMISRWGRDQIYGSMSGWTPSIKCSRCGSREIIRSVQANTVVRTKADSPFDRS